MPFSRACFPRGWVWFVKNSPVGYTQFRCTHPPVAVSGLFDGEDGQNEGTSESCPPVIKRINKKCVQHKTSQRASSTRVYYHTTRKFYFHHISHCIDVTNEPVANTVLKPSGLKFKSLIPLPSSYIFSILVLRICGSSKQHPLVTGN